jgi:hypothetical protein
MVVQIRAAGGRTVRGIRLAMVYLDDRGELPDDDQQARLRRHFEAAFRELTGQSAAVDIEIRPWQPDDGDELVSWNVALRRLDAR